MSNTQLGMATNVLQPSRDLQIAMELGAVRPDLLTHEQIKMLARDVKTRHQFIGQQFIGLQNSQNNQQCGFVAADRNTAT